MVSPTIGTVARVLVHETLAILAADLGDLLGGHLLLRRHTIPRHRLSIPRTHRHPVARIRIITRIVSWRTITLLHRVSSRHVPWHRLRNTAGRLESNLCLTSHVWTAFDLDDSLETVLDRPPGSRWPTGRHTHAERKCLSWTAPEIVGSGDHDVSREENVLPTLMLLDPRIVDRDPDEFCVILEDSSLDFNPERLDILARLDVYLSNHSFELSGDQTDPWPVPTRRFSFSEAPTYQ